MPAPPDLAGLLADPSRVAGLTGDTAPALLAQIAAEQTRLAALQTAVAARLAMLTNRHPATERSPTTPPSEQGQLTQEEAARAYRTPLRTMRRLTRTGRIPSTPLGRNRMIRPVDLDAYFARCREQRVKVGTRFDIPAIPQG